MALPHPLAASLRVQRIGRVAAVSPLHLLRISAVGEVRPELCCSPSLCNCACGDHRRALACSISSRRLRSTALRLSSGGCNVVQDRDVLAVVQGQRHANRAPGKCCRADSSRHAWPQQPQPARQAHRSVHRGEKCTSNERPAVPHRAHTQNSQATVSHVLGVRIELPRSRTCTHPASVTTERTGGTWRSKATTCRPSASPATSNTCWHRLSPAVAAARTHPHMEHECAVQRPLFSPAKPWARSTVSAAKCALLKLLYRCSSMPICSSVCTDRASGDHRWHAALRTPKCCRMHSRTPSIGCGGAL
jgi:hypothetical protein